MSEYSRLLQIAQRPTADALQRLSPDELAAVAEASPMARRLGVEWAYHMLRQTAMPLGAHEITLEHDGTYTVVYGDTTVARLLPDMAAADQALTEFFDRLFPRHYHQARTCCPAADTAPAPLTPATSRTPIASPVSAGEDRLWRAPEFLPENEPEVIRVDSARDAFRVLTRLGRMPVMTPRIVARQQGRMWHTCVAVLTPIGIVVYDVRTDGRLGWALVVIEVTK